MSEILNDESHLLRILPEVVWKKTLGKIKDSNSFDNSINASQYFRKHLLSSRTTLLFPKVFQPLGSRYDKYYSECYDDISDQVEIAAADQNRVWKYPGGYRLVCREWNKSVQQNYQYHHSHFWSQTDAKDHEWPRMGRCGGYYGWEHIDENFLDFYQEMLLSGKITPRQYPLFRRAVHLQINSSDVGTAVNIEIENFLQTHGHDIWYINLEVTNTNDTLTQFYFALNDLLDWMPNLKVLRLEYIKGRWQSWRAKSLLRWAIKICPLQKFPNLQYLEVLKNLPPPILNELLEKNNQVNKLDILAAGHKIRTLYLPNLRELYIRVRTLFEFYRLFIQGAYWKLEAFQIQVTCCQPANLINDIFELVSKNWSGTLRSLCIWTHLSSVAQKDIIKLTTNGELMLPQLKTFKLSIKLSVGLDFLLPSAKNLETIIIERSTGFTNVDHRKFIKYMRQQRIKFLGFETRLSKSNIWKEFPKLRKVSSGAAAFYRP